jgi:hypothetical protein
LVCDGRSSEEVKGAGGRRERGFVEESDDVEGFVLFGEKDE